MRAHLPRHTFEREAGFFCVSRKKTLPNLSLHRASARRQISLRLPGKSIVKVNRPVSFLPRSGCRQAMFVQVSGTGIRMWGWRCVRECPSATQPEPIRSSVQNWLSPPDRSAASITWLHGRVLPEDQQALSPPVREPVGEAVSREHQEGPGPRLRPPPDHQAEVPGEAGLPGNKEWPILVSSLPRQGIGAWGRLVSGWPGRMGHQV